MALGGKSKILVIRGGAIGDFLLTLPAIALLRENFPSAHLEILGYQHIVALAESGGLADATRSIEYSALSGFFNPRADLDSELSVYFASFALIVSYLFDPDAIFVGNLRRCGVKNIIEGSPKIDPEGEHAARQLAKPLERLALFLEDMDVTLTPRAAERAFAAEFLDAGAPAGATLIALHPGSGGERKNWAPENWRALARGIIEKGSPGCKLLLVGGEADDKALDAAGAGLPDILCARGLPLPCLAAILARCTLFLGHDSGISHLAAAVGCPAILLFGPTDPDLWAPPRRHARILRAPGGQLADLALATVEAAVAEELGRRAATASC